MFDARQILSSLSIFRGLMPAANAHSYSPPFEVELFVHPRKEEECVRPAVGREEEIPCLKGQHTSAAGVVVVDGQEVKVEETKDVVPWETLYLVNGNIVAVHNDYDSDTEQTTCDLGFARYVESIRDRGGDFSTSSTVGTNSPDGRVLYLSLRDEQALYRVLVDERQNIVIPLYPKAEGNFRPNPKHPRVKKRKPSDISDLFAKLIQ
jgi:hypothetical protein